MSGQIMAPVEALSPGGAQPHSNEQSNEAELANGSTLDQLEQAAADEVEVKYEYGEADDEPLAFRPCR